MLYYANMIVKYMVRRDDVISLTKDKQASNLSFEWVLAYFQRQNFAIKMQLLLKYCI